MKSRYNLKKIVYGLLLLFITNIHLEAQVSLVSWNIADFGKTRNEDEIRNIAKIVKDFDIVVIQEVVAIDPGGAKAVARLANQLNRMGTKWDYRVSDPTESPGKRMERYAYLWKTSKVTLVGRPWLEKNFEPTIYREPYLARFKKGSKTILVVNYHSRSYKDKPQQEIGCFSKYPKLYPNDALLFAGDYNTNCHDKVFQPLYNLGFEPNLIGQKTTLKRKCGTNGAYLNHPIDFILYNKNELELMDAGSIDFVNDCTLLPQARMLSDHLPVWIEINF